MNSKYLIMCCLFTVCALCHGKTELPEWMDQSKRDALYPSSAYYTGYVFTELTTDESPEIVIEKLKQRAMGDLMAKISVKVQRNTSDVSSEVITTDNAYSHSEYSSKTTLQTRKVELPGIEEKTFYDKKANIAAVLAFVPKAGLAVKLQRQLSNHLSRASLRLEDVETYMAENNKTKAVSSLESAKQSLTLADDTRQTMTAIDAKLTADDLMEAEYRQAEQKITALDRELNKSVRIFLNSVVEGDEAKSKTLRTTLSGDLSRKGCLAVSTAEESEWRITVTVTTENGSKSDLGGFVNYFAYAIATMEIYDSNGKPFYTDQLRIKGGHTAGYEQATADAMRQLMPELSKKIMSAIQK